MRLRNIALPCVLVALGAMACGQSPGTEIADNRVVLPRDLVGCYALFDHHGRPPSDSLPFAPPKVRLDSARHERSLREGSAETRWALARLDEGGRAITEQGRQPVLYWFADPASDSVRVRLSTGFYGSELVIDPRTRGDTLRGRATEHTDLGPPQHADADAGPVTMIRIPCVNEAG